MGGCEGEEMEDEEGGYYVMMELYWAGSMDSDTALALVSSSKSLDIEAAASSAAAAATMIIPYNPSSLHPLNPLNPHSPFLLRSGHHAYCTTTPSS